MVAVHLIVTGDMEQLGLARSLKKVFPDVDFSVQKVDGFTSTQVMWPPPKAKGVKSNIEKYATALIAALNPGRRLPRPDYVFGLDDLELENRGRPEAVIDAVRHAVAAELERRRASMNADSYDKLIAEVKDRCSFHLFVPMPEAYFFTDPAALAATGCTREAILAPDRDVESPVITDPDFLAAPSQPQPSWAIDLSLRHLHPKRYLQFLLEPNLYTETRQGVDALVALDWRVVLGGPQRTLFLRSLFQDLAYSIGLEISEFPGNSHPLTSGHGNQNRILRNL